MRSSMQQIGWLCGVLLLFATILGCGNRQAAPAAAQAPEVVVNRPVVKEITDYEDFTGRTEAVADVAVRARVTGYLDKVLFKEGTEVTAGDLLFEIDPRPYRAMLHAAEGALAQNTATLDLARTELARAEQLLPTNAIAGTDYDQVKNAVEIAKARVQSGEAALETAKLNLEFCSIRAPIGGRISRQLIDPGNLVQADQTAPTAAPTTTALTTIVSLHPIYAYFDVDERTMLRVRRLIRSGKIKSSQEAAMPVFLGLADEEGFPHEGTINFVDNRVDAMSGTLRIRGVFPNTKRILSPGLFARIRLPIGKPHAAILISEQALGSDQGQRFVYVVNDANKVAYRRVKVGPLQDGLRVIEEGLAEGERVVVSGVQRIKSGDTVEPKDASARSVGAAPPPATKPEPASGASRK
jgi:RND family efflux transporter MFP subunit